MFKNILADIKRLKPGFDHNAPMTDLFRQVPLTQIFSYFFSLEFQAVMTYRIARFCYRNHIPILGSLLTRITEIMTGVAIPAKAEIGKGLKIVHFGSIVIHSDCKIGQHCDIAHGVTVGERGTSGKVAVIGNNVMIGCYAVILGEVVVGDSSRIGAHAVVLHSVPPNSVVVGNPARIVGQNSTASLL